MSFLIQMAVGITVPAAVSLLIAFVLCRPAAGARTRHTGMAFACAIAFGVGYAILHSDSISPKQHWHWIPWLGSLAAVVSIAAVSLPSDARGSMLRGVIHLVIAGVASFALIPGWERLADVRIVYASSVAVGFFVLMTALDRLAADRPGPLPALALLLSAGSGAIFLALSVSAIFGFLSAVLCAALFGCWCVTLRHRSELLIRSAVPLYVVVAAGLMLCGGFASSLPRFVFALIPAAPAMLFVDRIDAVRRLSGKHGLAIQLVAVLIPIFAAFATAEWIFSGQEKW